ncbi:C-type lectin [Esox lucius]|uniref:C-type lectin n=1 Tax=Esox lucius TaxID=8010 RepID=UPI0014772924|nr:C-type lectin [Esox lucius]
MCYKKGPDDTLPGYKLVMQNLNWYEAQNYCRTNFTDLVSIMNDRQNEELKDWGMNSTTPFWIGLLYDDWEWADGGYSAYRNWPGTTNPLPNKYTVLLNNKTSLTMMSVPSHNMVKKAICSEELFKLIKELMTWEQALKYCEQKHNRLLHIESKEDQSVVEQSLRGANVPGPVWIGLRQSRLFGFWVWINGIPLKREDWHNWEGGRQPEQPLSHHCAAMAMEKGDFKWSDQDCLSIHYFICEDRETYRRV